MDREAGRQSYEGGRAQSTLWGVPFVAGVFTVLVGIFALIAAGVAGLASAYVFGIVLVAGGIAEMVFGIQHRRAVGLAVPILSGILSIIAGMLLLAHPIAGMAAIALVLALYFLASGLFRGISSVVDRYAYWGWDFVYGVVAILLGLTILSEWPISAMWMIGTLVGVELVFRGFAMMGGSMALRRGVRELTSTT